VNDEKLRIQIEADDQIAQLERMRPSMFYKPSRPSERDPYGGQYLFHRAPHAVRFLCPGNGWGKTAGMGHEVNAWATHSNRWQNTPAHPVSMTWFGPGESQWNKIRQEIFEPFCFDKPYRYLKGEMAYLWPDGSRLDFRSHAAEWTVGQGTNPDMMLFDELFPFELWVESQMRRRGTRKTRFVIAATQTLGMSWQHEAIYGPWLEAHKKAGLDEDQAMLKQLHPDIWCWTKGGIKSNPSMTEQDINWYYNSVVYSSDAEKRVRLNGGFGDWSGASVFDTRGVLWMQEQARKLHDAKEFVTLNGSILPVKEAA
jgi:hypothetical protein